MLAGLGQTEVVRLSARTDYAIRAVAHLAAAEQQVPVRADDIAEAQSIPPKYLLDILRDLRAARILRSQRGAEGGFWLDREPAELTIGEVIRVLDGPLANVHELSLNDTGYVGAAEHLVDVWKAMRQALRSVLDEVTFADLVSGRLPPSVKRLAEGYDATVR